MTYRGVNRHSGRLIENNEIFILKNSRHIQGEIGFKTAAVRAFQSNYISGINGVDASCRLSVTGYP